MAQESFERAKPHVKAGRVGFADRGELLLAALRKGRAAPLPSGPRTDFTFRTTDVTGAELPRGARVVPGGDTSLEVVPTEGELRPAHREGGRTVGAGVVADEIQ